MIQLFIPTGYTKSYYVYLESVVVNNYGLYKQQ